MLASLPLLSDPNIIVGMERIEDAGVYKLTDDIAIIQTVDFITPIVDDPYTFGQIAATNALSDVYAMGGKPLTAMNIVCFPLKDMDISILKEIMAGGLDKMREAGVVLLGGHSVQDPELKYGLSVTGTIHPNKVVVKSGVKSGDKLILTKPIGTGIISTALKGGTADKIAVDSATKSMTTLNRKASELMQQVGVHACTDITGFGLLGHAAEMIEGTDAGMVIYSTAVPVLPGAAELAKMGFISGGTIRNRDFRLNMIDRSTDISDDRLLILFDAQTSGGLLISVASDKASGLLKQLHKAGIESAAIIGEVVAEPKGRIIIK